MASLHTSQWWRGYPCYIIIPSQSEYSLQIVYVTSLGHGCCVHVWTLLKDKDRLEPLLV